MVFNLVAAPSYALWRTVMQHMGYVIYESADDQLILNITGWRNKKGKVDQFDDYITVAWGKGDSWQLKCYSATTVPGKYWLENLLNPHGTAIMVPGQYLDSYSRGLHKGKPALVQTGPVKVFRDSNRDDRIDCSSKTIETGLFGLNIHRAGFASKVIGKWSAGCQVFADETEFNQFMRLCQYSTTDKFSYSLVEFEYGM